MCSSKRLYCQISLLRYYICETCHMPHATWVSVRIYETLDPSSFPLCPLFHAVILQPGHFHGFRFQLLFCYGLDRTSTRWNTSIQHNSDMSLLSSRLKQCQKMLTYRVGGLSLDHAPFRFFRTSPLLPLIASFRVRMSDNCKCSHPSPQITIFCL